MNILIKNGRVINPATHFDDIADVYVVDGKVELIDTDITKDADTVIEAGGCFVMPGFIDLHVHLREPGFEYKETIKTGAMAAARGGYTSICPMPNTKPATDSPEMIKLITDKAAKEAVVNVLPVGAVTIGQAGNEVTDIVGMKAAGAYAISEDGKSVMNSELYKEAMVQAASANVPVFAHCEDKNLVNGGVINAGKKSEEFGVNGISNAVEDIITARDILLAKETGVKLHLCHCSTKDSVKMIKLAKEDGVRVTGEVCPHHFALSEADMNVADSNYKMNPPLRKEEDVLALKRGLMNNIMDVISTDHAPHSEEEKKKSIEEAPFGIVGLETAASLTYTVLVEGGYLTPMQMAEKMSYNPAKVLEIDKGNIQKGKIADIVVFDPNEEYVINVDEFASKGKNTPFGGMKVKGRVKYTMVSGNIVFTDK